jgi:hypothetical protein
MRATNGLQTTINLDPVNSDGQAFSLDLLLEMALPMPLQDERLLDQIEAYVDRAGLEIQRKFFQVLIEKTDKGLGLMWGRRWAAGEPCASPLRSSGLGWAARRPKSWSTNLPT